MATVDKLQIITTVTFENGKPERAQLEGVYNIGDINEAMKQVMLDAYGPTGPYPDVGVTEVSTTDSITETPPPA